MEKKIMEAKTKRKAGRKKKYNERFTFKLVIEEKQWRQFLWVMKTDTNYHGERNATAYLQYLIKKQVEWIALWEEEKTTPKTRKGGKSIK